MSEISQENQSLSPKGKMERVFANPKVYFRYGLKLFAYKTGLIKLIKLKTSPGFFRRFIGNPRPYFLYILVVLKGQIVHQYNKIFTDHRRKVAFIYYCFFLGLIHKIRIFKKPCVYFFYHSYYNYYFLAEALKKRGWKAYSVNCYEVNDPQMIFFWGWHKSFLIFQDFNEFKLLFKELCKEAHHVQFYSLIFLTHDPLLNELALKILRKLFINIGYTPSGCKDGTLQSEFNAVSGGICNKCRWQNEPTVCSDKGNQKGIDFYKKHVDFFSYEFDYPSQLRKTSIGSPLPVTGVTMDPQIWDLHLQVPSQFVITKKKKENLLVLTAFANEKSRTENKKDIKGIGAIYKAIEQLIAEGYPIEHIHANNLYSRDMRYLQVQADIIVDQLNYGVMGAACREGMMLAKPVIIYISKFIREWNPAMKECPNIDATEETIYEVLKKTILMTPEERAEIGRRSREWALKWFEADACAERFEKIYKRLRKGLPPYEPGMFDA